MAAAGRCIRGRRRWVDKMRKVLGNESDKIFIVDRATLSLGPK